MAATRAATANERISVASTKTGESRSRLAPISEKPFDTSHADSGKREASEREKPSERERIVADAPVRCALGYGHEQHRRREAGCHDGWREPVDGARALHADCTLPPKTPQLAVWLQWARPAATLETRLPVLDEAGKSGASRMPPAIWTAPAAAVPAFIRSVRCARCEQDERRDR